MRRPRSDVGLASGNVVGATVCQWGQGWLLGVGRTVKVEAGQPALEPTQCLSWASAGGPPEGGGLQQGSPGAWRLLGGRLCIFSASVLPVSADQMSLLSVARSQRKSCLLTEPAETLTFSGEAG